MRKKVRSDAVLLNLPEERQDQVIQWCDAKKTEDCAGGYQFAQEQLAADGVQVSLRALSDFYSDWHLRQDIRQAEVTEKRMIEADIDPQTARMACEGMLLQLSLAKRDEKLFTAASMSMDSRRNLDLQEKTGQTKAAQKERSLAQKDRDFALARERFITESCEKIMKAARDPKVREIVENTGLTNAEKIAEIRKAYFADIDEIKVELPE